MSLLRRAVLGVLIALSLIGPLAAVDICAAGTTTTSLRLTIDDSPGSQAVVGAALYTLQAPDGSGAPAQALPVAGGLILVSWGPGRANTCRMATGADGKATATFSGVGFDYPPGGQSLTYTATFCPFTAYPKDPARPHSTWMANCARIKDPNTGKAVSPLDYTTIAPCPGSGDAKPAERLVNGETHDLGDIYLPSTSFASLRNNKPSSGSVALCWSLAAVFGLLFSAMFVSGRNPLHLFDFSAGRGVRMNRSGGYYTPMTQNVSVAPMSILSAIDRAASTASSAMRSDEKQAENDKEDAEEGEVKAQDEFNSADKSGDAKAIKAAKQNLDGAKERLAKAKGRVEAYKELREAEGELAKAKAGGDPAVITAAQSKVNAGKAKVQQLNTEYANLGGGKGRMARRGAMTSDERTQAASQRGLASGIIGKFTKDTLDKVQPFDKYSTLGTIGNTIAQGMVGTVVLSTFSVPFGRGKNLGKAAVSSLKESAQRTGRATIREGIGMAINEGARALTPMLASDMTDASSLSKMDEVATARMEEAKALRDEADTLKDTDPIRAGTLYAKAGAVEGVARDLVGYYDEKGDHVSGVKDRIKALAPEVEKAKVAMETPKAEYEAAKAKVETAEADMKTAWKEWAEARTDPAKKDAYLTARKEVADAKADRDAKEGVYEKAEAEYTSKRLEIMEFTPSYTQTNEALAGLGQTLVAPLANNLVSYYVGYDTPPRLEEMKDVSYLIGQSLTEYATQPAKQMSALQIQQLQDMITRMRRP